MALSEARPPREFLRRHEAAHWAGVSVKTLDRHIADGELKVYRVGKSVRITEADLRAWIERTSAQRQRRAS